MSDLPVPTFVTNLPTALGELKEEKTDIETVVADDDEFENLRKLRKINFKRKLSGETC